MHCPDCGTDKPMRSHLLSDGKCYWECSECQHESEDTTEYDEEYKICGHCNGSGEGYSEFRRCWVCRGNGTIKQVREMV